MGLREDILKQPVSELELRDLVAVSAETPVREAVEKLRAARLGCAVVVDGEGRPTGTFTERALIKVLLEGAGGLDEPVSGHMAAKWASVSLSDPIAKVADCMKSKELRFVVVVDEAGKAVNLTGQKGVMEFIADHFPRQVKVQRMRSVLFMSEREGA